MKKLLPVILVLAAKAHGAWVIEDIATAIQYTNGSPNLIGKEMASAYRATYSATGAKTGEYIAIAYRSKYLYITQRQGTGWNGLRFDDNGRYPSIVLDGAGKPHMSYWRSSNNKLYYARTVAQGTGNCGPNGTWACEEIPTTIYGAPIGRSAITITGNNKVHILVETASANPSYPSRISRITKTVGAAGWDGTVDEITISKDLADMKIRIDPGGGTQLLLNSEYLDWYRLINGAMQGVGPLNGVGAFEYTSSYNPRVCYRDFTLNRLIYARSNDSQYWTETVLDYDIGPLGSCSIAIAPSSSDGILPPLGFFNPRIAYYDDAGDQVKYATMPVLSNQPWNVETVAAAAGTRVIDLYLDRQGRPSIIYFDSASLKLKLAKRP
ncbi:MAG: hypothetical protein NTV70_17190 [Acidobacteria bacterium]|nr:hypothetical protein [Acidobacteriota bacterium]